MVVDIFVAHGQAVETLEVEWELLDRGELHLVRKSASPPRTRPRANKS